MCSPTAHHDHVAVPFGMLWMTAVWLLIETICSALRLWLLCHDTQWPQSSPLAALRRCRLHPPGRRSVSLAAWPTTQPCVPRPKAQHPVQELMTDPASPILDFFPGEFRVDLEGKRADWEGVVLIPFLDVERCATSTISSGCAEHG